MVEKAHESGSYDGGEFLTFRLEQEIFGVPIETVREVLDYVQVTRVPGSVDFLNGVINLRGAVVPVADIRIKFGMPATAQMEGTCIIVVEVDVEVDEGKIVVGVLADQVLEVANISGSDMQMYPEMGTGIPSHYLRGLGKLGEKIFMVLDVDAIVRDDVEELSTGSLSGPAGHEP